MQELSYEQIKAVSGAGLSVWVPTRSGYMPGGGFWSTIGGAVGNAIGSALGFLGGGSNGATGGGFVGWQVGAMIGTTIDQLFGNVSDYGRSGGNPATFNYEGKNYEVFSDSTGSYIVKHDPYAPNQLETGGRTIIRVG